jgi:hypothetical protein
MNIIPDVMILLFGATGLVVHFVVTVAAVVVGLLVWQRWFRR